MEQNITPTPTPTLESKLEVKKPLFQYQKEFLELLTLCIQPAGIQDAKIFQQLITKPYSGEYINRSIGKEELEHLQDLYPLNRTKHHNSITIGDTPLHLLLMNQKNFAALETFLKHPKSNPNVTSENGMTPLMLCCRNHDVLNAATLLDHNNINVNIRNHSGLNVLQCILFRLTTLSQQLPPYTSDYLEIIEKLLGKKELYVNDTVIFPGNSTPQKASDFLQSFKLTFQEVLFPNSLKQIDRIIETLKQREKEQPTPEEVTREVTRQNTETLRNNLNINPTQRSLFNIHSTHNDIWANICRYFTKKDWFAVRLVHKASCIGSDILKKIFHPDITDALQELHTRKNPPKPMLKLIPSATFKEEEKELEFQQKLENLKVVQKYPDNKKKEIVSQPKSSASTHLQAIRNKEKASKGSKERHKN